MDGGELVFYSRNPKNDSYILTRAAGTILWNLGQMKSCLMKDMGFEYTCVKLAITEKKNECDNKYYKNFF